MLKVYFFEKFSNDALGLKLVSPQLVSPVPYAKKAMRNGFANNMEGFLSGQKGQTVNLLSSTSVVRIHLPPPIVAYIRIILKSRYHIGLFLSFKAQIQSKYASGAKELWLER